MHRSVKRPGANLNMHIRFSGKLSKVSTIIFVGINATMTRVVSHVDSEQSYLNFKDCIRITEKESLGEHFGRYFPSVSSI